MFGYDYYASLDRISNLVREVYEGTDFTKLELMRARQKRKMHNVAITRTERDEEAIRDCIEAFSEIAVWRTEDCYKDYDIKVNGIPFFSWSQVTILEEQYRRELEVCIQEVNEYLKIGIDNCESSNGRCPITVFKKIITSKGYKISVDTYIHPHRDPILLDESDNSIEIRNDSIFSNLLYLGQADMPYDRRGAELYFQAPLKNYTMDIDKKRNAHIKFSANTTIGNSNFYIKVYSNGSASIYITLQQGKSVSFLGKLNM